MNNSQDCEAGKGAQVLEGFARCEAAPTLVTLDENGVGDEEEERDPVREASGKRRAVESNLEGIYEEVVQQSVERRRDEKNVGPRAVNRWSLSAD